MKDRIAASIQAGACAAGRAASAARRGFMLILVAGPAIAIALCLVSIGLTAEPRAAIKAGPSHSDPLDPAQPITPAEVAVTVDDLPYQAPHLNWERMMAIERSVAGKLQRAGVSEAYGFVIGRSTEDFPNSAAALRDWLARGYPLGNHSYSHLCLSNVPATSFIADIERNNQFLGPIFQGSSFAKDSRVFRYPCLQEGDTLEKREAVREYLLRNRYTIAEVTIDYLDYQWDQAYLRCADQGNTDQMRWIRRHAVDAARRHLRRSQKLARLIFGRDIKHILLLHVSTFNSVALEDVLRAFHVDGVKFITLEQALADPVYKIDPKVASSGGRSFLAQMMLSRRLLDPYIETLYTEQKLDGICAASNR